MSASHAAPVRLQVPSVPPRSAGKNFSMIAVETNVTLVSFLFHPPRDADMSGATAKLENARLIVRMPKRHEKADSAAGTRRLLIERS